MNEFFNRLPEVCKEKTGMLFYVKHRRMVLPGQLFSEKAAVEISHKFVMLYIFINIYKHFKGIVVCREKS